MASSSSNKSITANAFDPNRPDIVQPYKSLVRSGLFQIEIKFDEMSITAKAIPTELAKKLDSGLGSEMSLQRARDWAEAHDAIKKPDSKKKKTNSSTDAGKTPLPSKSLDSRDFESGDAKSLQSRINEIFSNGKPGLWITRFYTMEGKTKKEYAESHPSISIVTLKGLFDSLVKAVKATDEKNKVTSIKKLVGLFSDEKHSKAILELDQSKLEILGSLSFPGGESNNLTLFSAVEAEEKIKEVKEDIKEGRKVAPKGAAGSSSGN
jgi:hypothetical protein